MSTPERMHVSVIYADPDRAVLRELDVEPGTTVEQAIALSGILEVLPRGFEPAGIGIFGRMASRSTLLHDGDRVELCRPLKIDPKQARRRRAEDQP